MKRWLVAGLAMTVFTIAGCSKPTDPAPVPTATPVVAATATFTPTAGGDPLPTATPVTPAPTPVPTATPGGTAYSVMYEVTATDTNWVQFTYLDNYSSYPTNITSGTWSTTVTMNSGFKAEVVCAYTGVVGTPAVTVNIYVNSVLQTTQSRSGMVPAFTTEYWLP